jgi:two-component system response regulator
MNAEEGRLAEILLVEDSPRDVKLTMEALRRGKVVNHLTVVEDGLQAVAFLRREGQYAKAPRPDLILLDLKLPFMSGHEVLAAVKGDDQLKTIPIIVLTCSPADVDLLRAYNLRANCYITKPVEFDEFVKVVQRIEAFWFSVVKLPVNRPFPS